MNLQIEKQITIPELIKTITAHFEESDTANLEGLKNEIANLDFDAIEEMVDFDSKKYCKTILHRVDQFEVILICWLPHQETPFHSHPENGCLMKILEGQVNEKRKIGNGEKGRILFKNDVAYRDGGEKHTITNLEEKSISLHIYSPSRFYE